MDKKTLIKNYKETPRPMGVYCVRNTRNGKLLVGSSRDLPAIINRQQTELRMKAHRNRDLQKDLNEFGADSFVVEILDTLDVPNQNDYDPAADLKILEQLWLDKLQPYGERGYHSESRRVV